MFNYLLNLKSGTELENFIFGIVVVLVSILSVKEAYITHDLTNGINLDSMALVFSFCMLSGLTFYIVYGILNGDSNIIERTNPIGRKRNHVHNHIRPESQEASLWGIPCHNFRPNVNNGLIYAVLLSPLVLLSMTSLEHRLIQLDLDRLHNYTWWLVSLQIHGFSTLMSISLEKKLHPVFTRFQKIITFGSALIPLLLFKLILHFDFAMIPMFFTVTLMQLFVMMLPTKMAKSFSFAETTLISQAIVFCIVTYISGSIDKNSSANSEVARVQIFLICSVVSMVVTSLLLLFMKPKSITNTLDGISTETHKLRVKNFLGLTRYVFCYLVGILVLYIGFYLHAKVDLILWVLEFTFLDVRNCILCFYWIILISISAGLYLLLPKSSLSNNSSLALHLRRKYYHLLIIFMLVPAINLSSNWTSLGLSVGLFAMCIVESIRVIDIHPISSIIDGFLADFVDEKDSGFNITSHFYLLLGCALPIWLNSFGSITMYAGIITLGVSDSVASIVGQLYGKSKWFRTKKTVEGSLGFVFSMHFMFIIVYLVTYGRYSVFTFTLNVLCITFISLIVGLLEALTLQNDNLIIPLATLVLFNFLFPIQPY